MLRVNSSHAGKGRKSGRMQRQEAHAVVIGDRPGRGLQGELGDPEHLCHDLQELTGLHLLFRSPVFLYSGLPVRLTSLPSPHKTFSYFCALRTCPFCLEHLLLVPQQHTFSAAPTCMHSSNGTCSAFLHTDKNKCAY